MTKNDFLEYCQRLVNSVPHKEYILLLILLCAGVSVFLYVFGWKRGWKYTMKLVQMEYCILLLSSMLIFRRIMKTRVCHFTPFWSYHNRDGVFTIYPEHVMNVAVFVPIGFFVAKQKSLKTWKGWLATICLGMGLSLVIEILQFIFKKGTCEIDDVINNTLGCLIGILVAYMIKK